jgi:hypothetical protein
VYEEAVKMRERNAGIIADLRLFNEDSHTTIQALSPGVTTLGATQALKDTIRAMKDEIVRKAIVRLQAQTARACNAARTEALAVVREMDAEAMS